jgi:hypothetical protein
MSETKEKLTMAKVVRDAILAMPIGTKFHGWELENRVKEIWHKHPNSYTETTMRVARRVARDSFKCLSAPKSLYERI